MIRTLVENMSVNVVEDILHFHLRKPVRERIKNTMETFIYYVAFVSLQ